MKILNLLAVALCCMSLFSTAKAFAQAGCPGPALGGPTGGSHTNLSTFGDPSFCCNPAGQGMNVDTNMTPICCIIDGGYVFNTPNIEWACCHEKCLFDSGVCVASIIAGTRSGQDDTAGQYGSPSPYDHEPGSYFCCSGQHLAAGANPLCTTQPDHCCSNVGQFCSRDVNSDGGGFFCDGSVVPMIPGNAQCCDPLNMCNVFNQCCVTADRPCTGPAQCCPVDLNNGSYGYCVWGAPTGYPDAGGQCSECDGGNNLGQHCNGNSSCCSGYCQGGICACSKLGRGQGPCFFDADCCIGPCNHVTSTCY